MSAALEEIAVVGEWLHRVHGVDKHRAVRAAGVGYLRSGRGRRRGRVSAGEHVLTASQARRIGEAGVLELAARNGQHVPGTPYNWRHGWQPLNVATALLHRKRRAAARLHAEGAPFADDSPGLKQLGAGLTPRGPADMSDDDLDTAMQDAIAREDLGYLDRLGNETDRRDAARAKSQRRADADRIRRQERADARLDRMGALIDEGVPEAEAYAEVFGGTPEQFRRKEAIRELREQGFEGAGFDELAKASFREHLSQAFDRATDETRGTLLNRRTEAANNQAGQWGKRIKPQDLFEGNEATARKYASEELRAWWDANGRPTFAEWRAQLLGDGATIRSERARRGYMSA